MSEQRKLLDKLTGRTPDIMGREEFRKYAVMICLIENENGEYGVLFEKRASTLVRQPGEICLPGGGRSKGETGLQNAVRETCEELLISEDHIEVIAEMNTMLTIDDSEIAVGLCILHDYKNTFDDSEVGAVFTVPLSYFLTVNPKTYINNTHVELRADFPVDDIPGGADYKFRTGKYRTKFYYYKDEVIWGLTATIMADAAKVIKNIM